MCARASTGVDTSVGSPLTPFNHLFLHSFPISFASSLYTACMHTHIQTSATAQRATVIVLYLLPESIAEITPMLTEGKCVCASVCVCVTVCLFVCVSSVDELVFCSRGV
jgi:hypothetical protein